MIYDNLLLPLCPKCGDTKSVRVLYTNCCGFQEEFVKNRLVREKQPWEGTTTTDHYGCFGCCLEWWPNGRMKQWDSPEDMCYK